MGWVIYALLGEFVGILLKVFCNVNLIPDNLQGSYHSPSVKHYSTSIAAFLPRDTIFKFQSFVGFMIMTSYTW